jgi:hypothetical protein
MDDIFSSPGCYEHRASWARRMSWRCGLGTQVVLLYLVALLPLPLFFRFVVLVTVHLYDPL